MASTVGTDATTQATEPAGLVAQRPEGHSSAWWGMVLLIVSESVLFSVLLASYFYVQFTSAGPWPPDGISKPDLVMPLVMTAVLVPSSAPLELGARSIRQGRTGSLIGSLTFTWMLATAFLLLQGFAYETKLDEFTWSANAYASLYHSITGLHTAHVVVGWLLLGFVAIPAMRGRYSASRHGPVRLVALFWHAVVGLWIVMLFVLHLSPHL